MATEQRILDVGGLAAEDLSSYQYHFVVKDPTYGTWRLPDSGTERYETGILQNAPESGMACTVRLAGISKCVANAALTVATYVRPEYVGATDAGKADDAAGELHLARAMVVEASSAEDDLCGVWLFGPCPARVSVSVPLTITANTTVVTGVFAATRAVKITKATIGCKTAASDADGTTTLALTNYDLSATTEDNLLGAATFDLEGMTAGTSEDLTLTSTAADLVLAAGDTIYASAVNNSAAFTTAPVGVVLTLELDLL